MSQDVNSEQLIIIDTNILVILYLSGIFKSGMSSKVEHLENKYELSVPHSLANEVGRWKYSKKKEEKFKSAETLGLFIAFIQSIAKNPVLPTDSDRKYIRRKVNSKHISLRDKDEYEKYDGPSVEDRDLIILTLGNKNSKLVTHDKDMCSLSDKLNLASRRLNFYEIVKILKEANFIEASFDWELAYQQLSAHNENLPHDQITSLNLLFSKKMEAE